MARHTPVGHRQRTVPYVADRAAVHRAAAHTAPQCSAHRSQRTASGPHRGRPRRGRRADRVGPHRNPRCSRRCRSVQTAAPQCTYTTLQQQCTQLYNKQRLESSTAASSTAAYDTAPQLPPHRIPRHPAASRAFRRIPWHPVASRGIPWHPVASRGILTCYKLILTLHSLLWMAWLRHLQDSALIMSSHTSPTSRTSNMSPWGARSTASSLQPTLLQASFSFQVQQERSAPPDVAARRTSAF